MAITEYAAGSLATPTASGSWSLPANAAVSATLQTTPGVYQLFLDASAMGPANVLEVAIVEKVASGSAAPSIAYSAVLAGYQSGALISPALVLMHGWDIRTTSIAGSDFALNWSIRKIG